MVFCKIENLIFGLKIAEGNNGKLDRRVCDVDRKVDIAVLEGLCIILLILGKTEMAYKLNLYIIPYLLFSTGVTEIYTFIRVRRKDETGNRALYPHEDRKTPERNEK